jgi:hypothetical protein
MNVARLPALPTVSCSDDSSFVSVSVFAAGTVAGGAVIGHECLHRRQSSAGSTTLGRSADARLTVGSRMAVIIPTSNSFPYERRR